MAGCVVGALEVGPVHGQTGLVTQTSAVVESAKGLLVPEGFSVTLYADDDLAHDIYSLTIDAQGRVVVAGLRSCAG